MEDLRFITKLGSGTHGSVYLFEDEKFNLVACKSFEKKYSKRALMEINILRHLNHVNIIQFISSFELAHSTIILMEYCNYGSLEQLISFFKRKELKVKKWLAWSLFIQMIDALYHLHSKLIVHRDIKPANILLNKRIWQGKEIIEFKICDFSLCTTTKNIKKVTPLVGTPYYMAPEILGKNGYDERVDIWGLGVCMYELFALKRPFEGPDTNNLHLEILSKIITEIPKCEDLVLKKRILRCLQKQDRPFTFEFRLSKIIYKRIDSEYGIKKILKEKN